MTATVMDFNTYRNQVEYARCAHLVDTLREHGLHPVYKEKENVIVIALRFTIVVDNVERSSITSFVISPDKRGDYIVSTYDGLLGGHEDTYRMSTFEDVIDTFTGLNNSDLWTSIEINTVA